MYLGTGQHDHFKGKVQRNYKLGMLGIGVIDYITGCQSVLMIALANQRRAYNCLITLLLEGNTLNVKPSRIYSACCQDPEEIYHQNGWNILNKIFSSSFPPVAGCYFLLFVTNRRF